jgi:hypothetical protein
MPLGKDLGGERGKGLSAIPNVVPPLHGSPRSNCAAAWQTLKYPKWISSLKRKVALWLGFPRRALT